MSDRSSSQDYSAERVIDQGVSAAITESGLVEIVSHNEFVYLTRDQFHTIAEFVREHPDEEF